MVRMMNTPDDFTGPVDIGNPREFTDWPRKMELTDSRSNSFFGRCLTMSHGSGGLTSRWPVKRSMEPEC
jgi:hypothetical protein